MIDNPKRISWSRGGGKVMTILIPAYEPDLRLIALIEKIKAACDFK